jgi:hypothetical protein
MTKDSHMGQTCIVIGNGNSLKDAPFDLIKRYPSFASNRIYLMPDFVCTYYVCINQLVVRQSAKEIDAYPAPYKFINDKFAFAIEKCIPLHTLFTVDFSRNPLEGIHQGYTVTFVCLQLAYWMGFNKVFLVGVDHDYSFNGKPNLTTVAKDDNNHFVKGYFRDGEEWQTPDLVKSEHFYGIAKEIYESNHRRIINLTPNTKEQVFEKGSYELLKEKN